MTRTIKVILLVENNGYPRDFRVLREATALRDAGYRVSVVAPRDAGERWVEDLDGIVVHRFPAPRGGSGLLGYALEFGYATAAMLLLTTWIALRRGVDVIHAANPPDTLFVIGAVFKLFGKKFVFDHHDLAPEIYRSRFAKPRVNLIFRCLSSMERCTYAVADVVIATNESFRRHAIDRGGKRAESVFVVRNGPPASYQPLPPDPALVARATHLIGYVGTIGPQDGLDFWLRAIRHLAFDLGRRDFLAIVIGDGDALDSNRRLARTLQIDELVHFTGRLPEVECRRILSATRVCVQPDPSNPLNDRSTMNKLMEYMALGKATVAFDLAETRVTAEEAALYARPNDESHFAECVAWLLDHPAECRSMGDRGRARVASGLLWEHAIPHLLRAYREGLGHPVLTVRTHADRGGADVGLPGSRHPVP